MADDHNIKTFTAADIEKYHKGQLSLKERHALEKAALDDPFLADALEGYDVAGVNADADIKELKRRLAERTEQAKVIPIEKAGKPFPWLRVAVIAVLLAGAGLLSYQFILKDRPGENALANSSATQKANATDSSSKDIASRPDANSVTISSEDSLYYKSSTATNDKDKAAEGNRIAKEKADQNLQLAGDSTAGRGSFEYTAPVANAVKQPDAEKKNEDVAITSGVATTNNAVPPKGDMVLNADAKAKQMQQRKPAAARDSVGLADRSNTAFGVDGYYNFKRTENTYRTNLFRGRVTDLNNNALPFANITNTRDNVGTYSDAQGNFTLISTDSLLNVQVKSLGYENNYAQLRNSIAANQVQMQEDRSLNAYVLDTVKRNLSLLRKNAMTIEEPEPEDGWDSWDTYVVNNTNVPESFNKKSGEIADNTVEISFEVNKNGEPVNLKVEKSLCDKCDREALRIVKEGPKWKRKAKRSKRTTVTVPFVKPE